MITDFDKLIPYAPHRRPMIWIDDVVRAGSTDGECLVVVKGDALYMEQSGLRASACIEFIAQAYGYTQIAYTLTSVDPAVKPLRRAFLAAIKSAELPSAKAASAIKEGDHLTVRISGVRHLGPIAAFRGEVIHNGQVLASAQMKVYSEH